MLDDVIQCELSFGMDLAQVLSCKKQRNCNQRGVSHDEVPTATAGVVVVASCPALHPRNVVHKVAQFWTTISQVVDHMVVGHILAACV